MEEAVWVVFGVISVIIGLAIFANVIGSNRDEVKILSFNNALDRLKNQCDFVCNSPEDTYSSVKVEIPSGTKLETFTDDNRVCGHLNTTRKYVDENKCFICKCNVTMLGSFNLQTPTALETFNKHTYSCYFGREEDHVTMECKG